MSRQRRRLKQPLDDLKENMRYWHLKADVLDRSFGRIRCKCPTLILWCKFVSKRNSRIGVGYVRR